MRFGWKLVGVIYHINILWIVNSGSTMTCSPDFNVFKRGDVLRYCSAHMGVTLALIPPVPSPMTTIAVTIPPIPAPLRKAPGKEVVTRMSSPTM